MKNRVPRPSYNIALILEDMAVKGWRPTDLARHTKVRRGRKCEPLSDMTIARFLKGEHQTAPVAVAIARALRRSVRRYLVTTIPSEQEALSA